MKVLLFLMFFLPGFAFAQTIVINEIAWMGVPLEGVDERQWWRYEWIELFNGGDQAVSLQAWRLELYSGTALDFTIVLYGSVPARGYFLAGASDRIPGVDANYATLSGKFKNSGQRVVLKDIAGNVIEEIEATSGWIAGDNDLKLTMERRFPERDAGDPENWGSSQNTGGTPKAQNSLFGKERFLALSQASLATPEDSLLTKREPIWSSFFQVITNAIFMRAFLVALAAAVAILALRRRLVRSLGQDEGSFDALKD